MNRAQRREAKRRLKKVIDKDTLADIDPALAVPVIQQKIDNMRILITESALELENLIPNPYATEAEKLAMRQRHQARKFSLKSWEEKLAAVNKALKGEKEEG